MSEAQSELANHVPTLDERKISAEETKISIEQEKLLIEKRKLEIEKYRLWVVGISVPLIIAIVSIAPQLFIYLSTKSEKKLKQKVK